MRLEHHLVGGYVRYISPHIIIIIIMTLIKQEKLVFILVILYIWEYLLVPEYPKMSNFGYLVPKITENAQPYNVPTKPWVMYTDYTK